MPVVSLLGNSYGEFQVSQCYINSDTLPQKTNKWTNTTTTKKPTPPQKKKKPHLKVSELEIHADTQAYKITKSFKREYNHVTLIVHEKSNTKLKEIILTWDKVNLV